MSTDVVIPDAATARMIRRPIGLGISIGEPAGEGRPGRPIDHFRFKPGQLDQYADAAEKALEVYGAEPKQLSDLYFLAATPPEVLDIRLRAWSKAGLRGFGLTNYAAIPDEDVFWQRCWAFDDDFTFRPRKASEVRPELRESWQGEPITGQLEGPTDPRIAKLGISLEASLTVCLPEVMGIGTDALISTKSRRSLRNLYKAVWDHYHAFGTLLGYPFRLSVRPARTERFDAEKREYVSTNVYELVLDTPFTFSDVLSRIRARQVALVEPQRERLGLPPASEGRAERDLAGDALGLPFVPVESFEEVLSGEVVEGNGGGGEGEQLSIFEGMLPADVKEAQGK